MKVPLNWIREYTDINVSDEELVAWGKTVEARDFVERAQQELKEKGLVQ